MISLKILNKIIQRMLWILCTNTWSIHQIHNTSFQTQIGNNQHMWYGCKRTWAGMSWLYLQNKVNFTCVNITSESVKD